VSPKNVVVAGRVSTGVVFVVDGDGVWNADEFRPVDVSEDAD
jgi:hypothetical protein